MRGMNVKANWHSVGDRHTPLQAVGMAEGLGKRPQLVQVYCKILQMITDVY